MTKLVGILNYTPNSFSDGGNFFTGDKALRQVKKLFMDGADIVDIGAMPTSYGVRLLSQEEEWIRLGPLLTQCANDKISIDTFYPETALEAIKLGVGMINDPSGGKDKRLLEVIASHPHIKYVFMYSLVLPVDRETRIKDYEEIEEWAHKKIEECLSFGIKKEQLIFDPGIGFVTTAEQSFYVIKNIDNYKKFSIPIYVGHSRKSFFTLLAGIQAEERDIETVAASLYMLMHNVDYLRVHNILWHNRAFNIFKKLGIS